MKNADHPVKATTKTEKLINIVIPIIVCAVGAMFIILPETLLIIALRVFGITAALLGTFIVLRFLYGSPVTSKLPSEAVAGAALMVVGIFTAINPEGVSNIVYTLVGAILFLDSFTKIIFAVKSRRIGVKSWIFTLVLAVINAAVALLLIIKPWDSAKIVAVILGASLVVEGLTNLFAAFGSFAWEKSTDDEAIEAEFTEKDEE